MKKESEMILADPWMKGKPLTMSHYHVSELNNNNNNSMHTG